MSVIILSSVPHSIIPPHCIVPEPHSPASSAAKYDIFSEDFITLVFQHYHHACNSALIWIRIFSMNLIVSELSPDFHSAAYHRNVCRLCQHWWWTFRTMQSRLKIFSSQSLNSDTRTSKSLVMSFWVLSPEPHDPTTRSVGAVTTASQSWNMSLSVLQS
jgi:hypothetical protein